MGTNNKGILKAIEEFLGKLLGQPEEDPLANVSADQLHIVLKSIEEKYSLLQEENRRLQEKVEEQQRMITSLEKGIADKRV